MSGGVVCVTGWPQSGKSTLAQAAMRRLRAVGLFAAVLDGDAVRGALVPRPGYGPKEREDFYATLAHLAGLLASQGVWVVVAATHPRRRHRSALRRQASRFIEVFVDASPEECEARDKKGLYRKFRRGQAATLPGPGEPYEPPRRPDVVASGGRDARAVEAIALEVIAFDRRRARRCRARISGRSRVAW